MSRADNKRGVFNNIKAYNSLNQQGKPPTQTDLMTSVNNTKETIPFLLDVLKTVAGAGALKILIGNMLTKMVGGAEPKLKTALKKQFTQSNASDPLPTTFRNSGVNMPIKDIDTTGKLKVNPSLTETGGKILYGQPSENNFDYKAHDAIRLNGTPVNCNNMSITYNSTTDKFNVKPNVTVPDVNTYFNNYIDNTQLINSDEIVSNTMDRIYGTLSNKQKKTPEQILDELMIEKMLEQVLNGDDSFEISPDDLNELRSLANQLATGVVGYDMGCGYMPAQLSIDDLNKLINAISGSTNAFAVGNAVEAALDSSVSGTSEIANENKETIRDGFFQKMINTFTVKLLSAVTTAPQVRTLMGMMSSLQNNGKVLISNAKEDLKKWKVFIKCMAKEIMIMVAEFIFLLALVYLMKLLTPVIKRIVKEKINQFKRIIVSLTAGKAAKLAEAAAPS
jgi:Na+-transporting methylmalonyl-CoA/oxaloacetate decarboxylase gamma subunit